MKTPHASSGRAAPPEDWPAFLESIPGGGFFHSEEHGRLLALSGWRAQVIAVRRGDRLAGGAVLAIKRIPGSRYGIAQAPRGILLAEWAEEPELNDALAALRRAARAERAILIELGAMVVRAREEVPEERGSRIFEALRRAGCEHRESAEWSTFWIDLQKDDDAILADMSAGARRHIRAAQRAGVQVIESHGPSDLDTLYDLHRKLYQTKGLTVTPEVIFARGVPALVEAGKAGVFWAVRAGTALSCAVISLSGTPRYLWGGRDPASAESDVASGYLLHFGIMQALRERGKRIYDLGGSPAAQLDPSHPNYGVWRFKRGIGGVHVDFVEGFRLVLSPALCRVYDTAFPLYRRLFRVSPFLPRGGR